VQRLDRAGLVRIGPAVIALADAEGLAAHAESIAIRLRTAGKKTPAPRRERAGR
jgi:histidinol dehydrogenase